jgi:hypothetical protein
MALGIPISNFGPKQAVMGATARAVGRSGLWNPCKGPTFESCDKRNHFSENASSFSALAAKDVPHRLIGGKYAFCNFHSKE